jgi:hypothetical protein
MNENMVYSIFYFICAFILARPFPISTMFENYIQDSDGTALVFVSVWLSNFVAN